MNRIAARLVAGLVGLIAAVALATPAHADSIVTEIRDGNSVFHFGDIENGGVSYTLGVEFYADSTGRFVRVRGFAEIDKEFRALGVRVDRVRVGIVTAPGGILTDARSPATDRGTSQAFKQTLWVPVTSDVTGCPSFTVATRAWFTVKWADGRYGSFSVLSNTTATPTCRR